MINQWTNGYACSRKRKASDETFSPIVKQGTIHIVFSLALVKNWDIWQLEVKNALWIVAYLKLFLLLNHHVFGMIDSLHIFENSTRLSIDSNKPLGLGFHSSTYISKLMNFHIHYLFIYHKGSGILILLLYVDDIILIRSNVPLINYFIEVLYREYAIKDHEYLHYFLGVQVKKAWVIVISRKLCYRNFTVELIWLSLSLFKLLCLPKKIVVTEDTLFLDPTKFRSLVGTLQYLMFTRTDISYTISYITQFMHCTLIFRWSSWSWDILKVVYCFVCKFNLNPGYGCLLL